MLTNHALVPIIFQELAISTLSTLFFLKKVTDIALTTLHFKLMVPRSGFYIEGHTYTKDNPKGSMVTSTSVSSAIDKILSLAIRFCHWWS